MLRCLICRLEISDFWIGVVTEEERFKKELWTKRGCARGGNSEKILVLSLYWICILIGLSSDS